MNIFSSFAPNKLVKFDDRDPLWMNNCVKGKIKWKNQLYKTHAKNGYKYNDQEATNVVSQVVSNRKQEYKNNIALKLDNLKTSTKSYWSVLKTFF